MNFQDIKSISNVMDIRQLLSKLSYNQLCLIECGYRAKGWIQHPIYEDGKEVRSKVQIFMSINRKNEDGFNPLFGILPHFFLKADHMTGEVSKDYKIDKYLDSDESISLDELLSIFSEKYSDELDFTELKESVYDHKSDMELRYRVLQLAALKLLYSKNTIPERGYKRAKRFINEFNKELNLTLSTEEIDEVMHRDYINGEGFCHISSENDAKKEKSRGLIKKSTFRKK